MTKVRRCVVAITMALLLAIGVAPAAIAQVCGCTDTGAYTSPDTEARVTGATSPGGGDYTLSTSNTATQATLTVRRASTNAIVQSFTVPLSRLDFGWSPDGKRFMVRHGFPGSATLDEVVLWDLVADRQVVATSMTAGAATAFSPHGRWFLINQLHGPGWAGIAVYDAAAPGTPALSTDIIFSNVPGSGADSFGSIGTGFSSDDADRSFVYAYRATNGTTQVVVRNLETRQNVVSTSLLNATGAFWRFSPCGDAFGLVSSPLANTASVQLYRTTTSGTLGAQQFMPIPAVISLESTLAKHRVKTTASNGTVSYTNLADNTADTECAAAPALSTLTLNRSSATGGSQHATATLTLTRAATSAMTATLSSSDPSAATVPSSVTISSGATTRTFTVTSRTVTAPRTVTISATVAGVTKTATLTVNPAATPPATRRVTGLAVTPTGVTGGQAATATVTLDGAAPSGGTAVTLSSSSGAASLPASTTVPAGQSSHSVVVATTPVPVDTAATLTATGGGGSTTATLTVRAEEETTSPEAVVADAACTAATLPRNDDGSTGAVPLPFSLNFFGVTADSLFVNNNGNVTFGSSLSTFTPFRITADTPPIIAPFLADVDTRGALSKEVTYSTAAAPATFGGRPAFCVNWVDVGYYPSQTDKLNSIQLLLVDRSDVAPGDFDIVMNYDRVRWETGSASGGSGGFGGSSAGAGYSAGTGDPTAFYEFPGTLVNGALLDSNPDTGLTRTSRGTLQLGRHVFEVRNGAAPTGATLSGVVTDGDGTPLVGAPVQVCAGTVCRAFTSTGMSGRYQAPGLPAGDYTVTVRPPAGSALNPRTESVTVGDGGVVELDLVLTGPTGPDEGTTLTPSWENGQGIPSVYWGDPIDLDTTGCEGGTGTWEVRQGAEVVASGALAEGEPGRYSGQIPPLRPVSGAAQVVISITCPDGSEEEQVFDIYIDPSGNVRTLLGTPVPDALVTLYRADGENGPFTVVPDGSAIMSPTNRTNPDLTDADGHFGWDTVTGYYVVRAERDGCTAPDGSGFVETPVLPVPPEWTDLDLRLVCPGLDPEDPPVDTEPPVVAASVDGDETASATVTLTADDGETGTGVVTLEYRVDGGAWTVYDGPIVLDGPGTHVVEHRATDGAGNLSEVGSVTVIVVEPLACPEADPRPTVVIGGVDSGVPNRVVTGGCTINDLIDDESPWATHGRFVQHVNEVLRGVFEADVVDGRERGLITRAAGRSGIGRPDHSTGPRGR